MAVWRYKIKIDGQARVYTFKVYFLVFMNVHMHTQLQLVRIKYIQKHVQRATP